MDKLPTLVSKLDAARRQIDASIRMLLLGIDPLAVHTVAGAAAKIVEELLRKDSRNPIQEQLGEAIAHVIHDYLTGKKLSEELVKFAKFMTGNMTTDLKRLLAEDNFSDADLKAIARVIPKDVSNHFRSELFQTITFLKHSDRDPDGKLAEDQIDNIRVIYHASKSYLSLGLPPTKEMVAMMMYALAQPDGDDSHLSSPVREQLSKLRRMDEPAIRSYCLSMLSEA